MNNQPIGILDSGVGGLTIWREIALKLPKESTIYIGDSLNCPYGNKSIKEIHNLSRELITFLLKKKVKLIVIACNTVTVSCLDKLRSEFSQVPIIGTVPVIKTAVKAAKNKKIGVLSTVRTAESSYQKDLIQKFAKGFKVINRGTDKLVSFIEKGELEKIEKILRKELKVFIQNSIDVLALGCTHFPYLKSEMQKILGEEVLILDSGAAIARQTERVLLNNNALSSSDKGKYVFYTTGDKKSLLRARKGLISYNILLKEESVQEVSL